MKYVQYQFCLLLSLLALFLTPQVSLAAPALRPVREDAAVNAGGVEFKVAWENGRYAVYMRPTVTPDGFNITLTAQVTIKVPHATGADRFMTDQIQSMVEGVEWAQSSRVDAPAEDAASDYLSFTVNFTGGDHRVYQWAAGQEIKLFTFANAGTCQGAVGLMENGDVFNRTNNSANTNPGNQIDILGIDRNNAFIGAYDAGMANCSGDAPDRDALNKSIFFPVISR